MTLSDPPSSTVLARLETILRRDLKLGPDAVIEPDMILLGGDYDLDSLDVLLLLTSIEKEFHVKIPSEEVRRDAFSNLNALARFVEQRMNRSST